MRVTFGARTTRQAIRGEGTMATSLRDIVNPENQWRVETPKPQGWQKTPYPDAANKYYMISVDSHLMPPFDLFQKRVDRKWHDMLPRLEVREGTRYIIVEGA